MKRILFVDDEQNVLDGLQALLWKYRRQMQPVFALGGEAALDELRKAPFDVIVSDMRMPGMDGPTLLSTVKRDYPNIVRIVLSGHAEQTAIFRALPVAHQFLAKPCEPERMCAVVERACRLQALLSDETLRLAVGNIERLPSLPATYQALMEAMAMPNASARSIARIIEQDSAMAAKILQLVNSACFGPMRTIMSIDQAVAWLGMDLVKSLALTVNIFDRAPALQSLPFSFAALQEHSLLTAKVVSRIFNSSQQAQEASSAALLHDIGYIIFASCIPERFTGMIEAANSEGRPLPEIEKETLGVTHAEVGAYLLALWGLPYPVVEAVAFHHQPEVIAPDSFEITSALYAADTLVDEAMSENGNGHCGVDAYLTTLGLASEFTRWKAFAAEEVTAWKARK